jgi:hypothetical protein
VEERQRRFYQAYYGSMIGGTVVKIDITLDGFPQFVLMKPDGTAYLCEVSCDPEGNGPGFLFGLPTPTE